MKIIPLERIRAKLANLDILIYLVWFLLILLLVATLKLQYFSILFPAIFANIGIIIYLVFKKRSELFPERGTDHTEQENNRIDRTIPVVSSILFFIIFSISLLAILQESYTKSILYYLGISVCAAILIFEIFSFKSVISRYVILFQAVLLSLNIVFANHLIFIHGITQPDFSFHFRFVNDLLTTGHITTFQTYGLVNVFAFHHIFASEVTLLTGYNPQSIYLLLGSFLIAMGVLFVFIIGKRFVNFQLGLLVAVLFTCLDFYLMEGEHPEHVAYSFGFALVCVTIALFTYRSRKSAFYLLFMLSAVALTLTHHLTAVIVFVIICSLVLIDIFHFIQTRERSFPSMYLVATFVIFLFIMLNIVSDNNSMQLLTKYFEPYFIKIHSLITIFLPPPASVVSIPVTPIPVTPIPVTPIPVTPIPVTPIPVTPIPVTPIPVTPIPVTPAPITPPPYGIPTAYDKLPIITLFENTLGSSLLVLVSILGFCSLLKKRSWFGNYTIISAILLSFLLGIGILIPIAVLLPDRLYPALQIFSLVFLGAFGILWIRNSVPIRNKSTVVLGICILVGMMSFFSLASIINGFETSPFVGENVAYPKIYITSQDVSFDAWRNSFIQNDNRNIFPLPINNKGQIDTVNQPGNAYFIFDRTRLKSGLVSTTTGIFGQLSLIHIKNEPFQQSDAYSSYYDNGLVNLMVNAAPV